MCTHFTFAGWQIFQLDTSIDNAYYEIRGISGHKNLFSTVLFLLISFSGIAFFKLKNHWRKLAISIIVLILVLIIYLRTRSVYLGILFSSFIFLYFKLNKKMSPKWTSILNKALLILALLSILVFLYLLQSHQLIPLLQTSKLDVLWQSDTGYERLILWEKTSCIIKQSPIWGVGIGNWQIEYPNCSVHGLYSVEVDSTTYQRPHNDWLWVWAETGIIGLICYLGFFVTLLKSGLKQLKDEVALPNHSAMLVRLSIIVGFMIIAFFSFPKERIEIILLIYSLIGLYYPSQKIQMKKATSFGKMVLLLIIIGTSLNLYIGKKRISGEKNMKDVLVLKQQQKWPEMIQACDRSISKWYTVDPTTIPINWYRGTAHFIIGNQEEALNDFIKAESYTPFNQHVQNDLGSCYEKNGQREKAMAHYKEAIRISPLFDDPRINIGVSFYNQGNYVEALDWINSIGNHELKLKYREIIENKIKSNN